LKLSFFLARPAVVETLEYIHSRYLGKHHWSQVLPIRKATVYSAIDILPINRTRDQY